MARLTKAVELRIGRRALLGAGGVVLAAPHIARSQGGEVIRLVVPYGAAGSTDVAARVVAARMATELGQTIIIENKPGGGSMVGMQNVAHSRPDGYSLLFAASTAALLPAFDMPMPIDPQKDLIAVGQVADIPCLFSVNAHHPSKTLAEFSAWLKEQPGTVYFATSSSGAVTHLFGELINLKIGRKMEHISYKGFADSLRDVLGGFVPALADVVMPVDQQIRAGTMRGLVLGSAKRMPMVPDVPTGVDLGFPDLQAAVFLGIMAPAATPAEIVARYNAALNKALASDEVLSKLAGSGFILTGGSPAAYTERLSYETVRWRRVIQEAHIPPPA